MDVSKKLSEHISGKITYHRELLKVSLEKEDYLDCAYHRDEIERLKLMLKPVGV